MGGVAGHAEDLALVRAVLDADPSAQRQLLAKLVPHLRVVARTLTRNPSDVDDAVQMALMRVLEGLSSYRGESSLVRWARRVASRVCLRLQEQDGRRLQVVAVGTEADAPAPAPTRRRDELPRELAEYLDALPEAQREVLVLRHVLEHTVPEIAELLEVPADTIKSRLLYARRAIRKSIRRDVALGRPRDRQVQG
jgi:RNA polymerase sigma-70 factor (ECF subfamily)